MTPKPVAAGDLDLMKSLAGLPLFGQETGDQQPFSITAEPIRLPDAMAAEIATLGSDLAAFQSALNELYWRSLHQEDLGFVRAYLDQGKDETLRLLGQMKRLRGALPIMIRPDLLWTEDGLKATELDSVPGGFGLVASLQAAYARAGHAPWGGAFGMVDAVGKTLASLVTGKDPLTAIVVSDESGDYRSEMEALADLAAGRGFSIEVLSPKDLSFSDDGLFCPDGRRIDVLYRFFELFDWRNVPKAEIIFYLAKKRRLVLTPPVKAYLEEKLALALFSLPRLHRFWQEQLGESLQLRLKRLFPESWVVDSRILPPYAEISGLSLGGEPVQDFSRFAALSQRQRQDWLLKPSGFSPLAWGGHGVRLGSDLSQEAWQEAWQDALEADRMGQSPWILQRYYKPEVMAVERLEPDGRRGMMEARWRVSPYYLGDSGSISLGGVLVTAVPKDKKLVHGMSVAVMSVAAAPDHS